MLKIVFMGTADFAVPSLQLLSKNHNIVAVVTATDKPQGRGNKIIPSAVKNFAIENKIRVLQPEKLREESFLEELDDINADLYVVAAFRMLPKCVWGKPRLGTINLHASLLPDYRGAAPINWALINGEKKTGLTTFFIDEKIDTGKIILQTEEKIFNVDTFETLHTRLKNKGARLLLETVNKIENGTYNIKEQDFSLQYNSAPKINPENCKIDFTKTADEVFNFIRGLSHEPGAWTFINGIRFKIKMAFPINLHILNIGQIASDGKNFLYIGTRNGIIAVYLIQPEGKKTMKIKEFLAGYWSKVKI